MNHLPATIPFTERQTRVIAAMVKVLPAGTWLSRESIDKIAAASNGPDIIRQIRHVTGHDGVLMERREVTDKDGKTVRAGQYQLTEAGYQRLIKAGFKSE